MPNNSDLLNLFKEAYRNLDLLPLLEPEELRQFRVDYALDVLEDLEQLVEDSPSGDSKIVFSGHRGCGKSTLLAEFARKCSPQYFVVGFSIADTIEMSDVNHINILFAIAVSLMTEAEKHKVKINKSTKDDFYKWFATHTKIETETLSAETAAGFNFWEMLKGQLKANAAVRQEIKQKFQPQISVLISRINEIAKAIASATQKEILVIIDDLDKLDLGVVTQVYRDNVKAIFQPNFRIIFTIPIAALRDKTIRPILDTETNNQIVMMPVSKLFEKGSNQQRNPKPLSKNVEVLRQILEKRVSEQILESGIADQMALSSGGVLRELIRIANKCCQIGLVLIRRNPTATDITINQEILQEAIIKLRNDFDLSLSQADYEILRKIYNDYRPDDPNQHEFLLLLHGVHIIEYRDTLNWYNVHPIVVDLFRPKT
jgi:nucleoside-triphosphatase THEP1